MREHIIHKPHPRTSLFVGVSLRLTARLELVGARAPTGLHLQSTQTLL